MRQAARSPQIPREGIGINLLPVRLNSLQEVSRQHALLVFEDLNDAANTSERRQQVLLDQRKIPLNLLTLDSRNQESAQIPGFWNPMVKRCSGIFL